MNSCGGCKNCKKGFYDDVIHCLVSALDYRDHYTKGHSGRVGDIAFELADIMGMDENMKELIHIAGHLHDIGKIGIADQILLKKGALTEVEWGIMKKHPQIGADIVEKASSLKMVGQIILQHHERWDGKGYPNGLIGDEIHIAARVIALCDTVDAMASRRPYRENFDWEQIYREIKSCSGTQFDPGLSPYMDDLIRLFKRYNSHRVDASHAKFG
ncbi:HD-GYP domain-containing protein [Fusibacter sp. JL216-2]|uniref:HD-GYP domain-containing protein n=1 Tax=Fusibacter sp. JL216-2 TaxID=3071453 RepID=UPI003D355236